jgi:hypothetical protein
MATLPPDAHERNDSPFTVSHEELVAKAQFYSAKILDGEIPPYDGATLIWKECHLKTFPGDHTFDPFVYWQDEYEDAQSEGRRARCAEIIRQFAAEFLGGPAVVLDPADALPSHHPSRRPD